MKNKKILQKYSFSFIIALVIILIIFPLTINEPEAGIDPSMITGFHLSDNYGYTFGTDISLTYGPLYFLGGPIKWIDDSSFSMLTNINRSVFIYGNISLVVLTFLALFFFYIKIFENTVLEDKKEMFFLIPILIISFLLFIFIPLMLTELLGLLSIFLAVDLVSRDSLRLSDYPILIFLSLSLALLPLVKFSYFAFLVSILIIILIYGLVVGRSKRTLLISGLSLVFFVVIWTVFERKPLALLEYIRNGFIISSGYSESVIRPLDQLTLWLLILSLIIILIWCVFLIISLVKKNIRLSLLYLIGLPTLFLFFKEGFVRPDPGHYPLFFKIIIFLFLINIILLGYKYWKSIMILFLAIVIAIPCSGDLYSLNLGKRIIGNYKEVVGFNELIDIDDYEKSLSDSREKIKKQYFLSEDLLGLVDRKDKLDIFPFDVSLLYAHGFNWYPRPIFQSYVAYDSILDDKNSKHFSTDDSPDKVLYKIYNYENNYQVFDEPATFRTMLENYKVIYCDDLDGWMLLEKEDKEFIKKQEIIVEKEIGFGEKVIIPPGHDDYLYLFMDIELSLIGQLKKYLYKGGKVSVTFYYLDGKEKTVEYYFNRKNAVNGLFISKYVENIWDLREVFEIKIKGDDKNKMITAFELNTDDKGLFDKKIKIKLLESSLELKKDKIISVEKGPFTQDKNRYKFNIDKIYYSEDHLNIEGWAIDQIDPESGKEIRLLLFKNPEMKDENLLGSGYYGLSREDVSSFYGNTDYVSSGFYFKVKMETLEENDYNFWICILNSEGIYDFERISIDD